MILFRPTGLKELQLVRDSDWRAWPPRLPDQPIFYPVTTQSYAEKIARDWNSILPAPDNLGFVNQFEFSKNAADAYPVKSAGGKAHTELRVPAEELEQFNAEITSPITIVAAFRDGSPLPLHEARALV